jgi:fructose-specific component phosphotransferase system IIB-like protein
MFSLNYLINIRMNKLILKSKKTVTMLSGLLFVGVILQTLSQKIPVFNVRAEMTGEITSTAAATQVENIIGNTEPTAFIQVPQNNIPDEVKVVKIRTYLENRNSPLAEYAEEFIKAANEHGIDYRIVVAISIIESGGGKKNFRPYNAWGWGKNGFTNWTEGIWAVSAGIGRYYSKGLTTPRLISYSYCPPNADVWASKVQGVMNVIGQ